MKVFKYFLKQMKLSKSKESEYLDHLMSLDWIELWDKKSFENPLNGSLVEITAIIDKLTVKSLIVNSNLFLTSKPIFIVESKLNESDIVFVGEMLKWTVQIKSKDEFEGSFILSLDDYYGKWLVGGKRRRLIAFQNKEPIQLEFEIEPIEYGYLSLPTLKMESEKGGIPPQIICSYKKAVKAERKQRISSSWFVGTFLTGPTCHDAVFEDDRKSLATLNE